MNPDESLIQITKLEKEIHNINKEVDVVQKEIADIKKKINDLMALYLPLVSIAENSSS